MRTVSAIAVVLALLLVSCAPPPDTAGLKKAVEEYTVATKDGMMNGNSDKALAFYEDNAMEMAPNMAMAKGKAAIKEFNDQMMKGGMKITAVTFTPIEIEAGGNMGHVIGTYDMTVNVPQMGDVKDKGKYITIWAQGADKKWKVRAETWNSDMPVPSMEPPAKDAKKKK